MSTLQNLFNKQPQANGGNIHSNQIMSRLNPEQKNIVIELMRMPEQERAEKLAQILNQNGITKTDLENLVNRFRR